jgi:hypothetical protein
MLGAPLQRFLCGIDGLHSTAGIDLPHADRGLFDFLGLFVDEQKRQ